MIYRIPTLILTIMIINSRYLAQNAAIWLAVEV